MLLRKHLILLGFLLVVPSTTWGKPLNRTLLAVLDGEEIKAEYNILIAREAEMPLNFLGFKLRYADVSKGLPTDDEMKDIYGIISWFQDNTLAGAENYARWLIRQLKEGKKLVVLDEFGFDLDGDKPVPENLLNEFYRAFGISYDPKDATTSPLLIEVVYNDPEMTEFERSLKGGLTNFEKTSVLTKDAKVYLRLKKRDTGAISDAIFTNSKGGHVLSNYTSYDNPINYQTSWRINPFKFFSEALDAGEIKPDISTLNGMRIFYSHIDGDGIRNTSYVDRKTPCSEMAYDKIFLQQKLPISVSVVIGDILMASDHEKTELIETLKKTYQLSNIEPASHGWAHPLIWARNGRKMAFTELKGYTYSPENEIGKSIQYINENLVPKDKKTNMFFWTGNCVPDYEALKYVYDNNITNINGGDTRFDTEYPSYTNVAPLFRHVGDLLQNYSSDSNETIYTNMWSGPFYGYKYVIETFEKTEKPIRIKPIDVYYHYYVMEHQTAIDAVTAAYEWAESKEIAPIFTSDYLNILNGFNTTSIDKVSQNHWTIANNGTLRTFRKDSFNGYVDMEKSKGVLGFIPYQGALYIHLDNGEKSEIALTNTRPTRPYLVKANGIVEDWKAAGKKTSFRLKAIDRIRFTVGGLAKNYQYNITVKDKKFSIKSSGDGELAYSEDLIKPGFEWIDVGINLQ